VSSSRLSAQSDSIASRPIERITKNSGRIEDSFQGPISRGLPGFRFLEFLRSIEEEVGGGISRRRCKAARDE
jgi:hypothetical protein